MRLAELMKKGALTGAARKGNPATLATLATVAPDLTPTVAKVATVATLLDDRTPSDAASCWVLPDGRTLWVSPSETLEQVQLRHPGAIPLPDSVTVTEPGTEGERQAIAYAEKIQTIREQGRVPGSYTATTFCEQCGPVLIFQSAPPRGIACPWCFNRVRGLPIPRPNVSCASCVLWRPEPEERGALVSCEHTKARYPGERKPCAYFQPSEDKQ